MASQHCGNTSPHDPHEYAGTAAVINGKLTGVTHSCPGTEPEKSR